MLKLGEKIALTLNLLRTNDTTKIKITAILRGTVQNLMFQNLP